MINKNPYFCISLDFELFWGMRDVTSIQNYGKNILGARRAIPHILKLFKKYRIKSTWAIVGLLTFENKKQILNNLPEVLPNYKIKKFNPYPYLEKIGYDENDDPYHYGYSIVKYIQDDHNVEIASHSFSHYYCMEKMFDDQSFFFDVAASIKALKRIGANPTSYVFCRNQYQSKHLKILKQLGFKTFRGNENHFLYNPRSNYNNNIFLRSLRFSDSLINFSGEKSSCISVDPSGLINVPSSHFLRPSNPEFIDQIRLNIIKNNMNRSVKKGCGYHLWWHPHNFGTNLKRNLSLLEEILVHFKFLQDKYGMESINMADSINYC